MITAELFTEQGHFVARVLIPPFDTSPDVIIWGIRVFKAMDKVTMTYRECFAVAAMQNATDQSAP